MNNENWYNETFNMYYLLIYSPRARQFLSFHFKFAFRSLLNLQALRSCLTTRSSTARGTFTTQRRPPRSRSDSQLRRLRRSGGVKAQLHKRWKNTSCVGGFSSIRNDEGSVMLRARADSRCALAEQAFPELVNSNCFVFFGF